MICTLALQATRLILLSWESPPSENNWSNAPVSSHRGEEQLGIWLLLLQGQGLIMLAVSCRISLLNLRVGSVGLAIGHGQVRETERGQE